MRFPRVILNPSVVGWIRLLQRERRENARLRRELVAWQDKFLHKVNVTPLFQPAAKTVSIERPPIGVTAKRALVAKNGSLNAEPTAEEILSAAANVKK